MRSLLLTLAVAVAAPVRAGDWPGFRGTSTGLYAGAALPTRWSETENIGWATDLAGYGQSAPVVWDGRVYVTAVDGPDREKGFVQAIDAKTGKELWRHAFAPTQKAKWAFTVSRAAPTPCADAAGVYCFFEGGNLIALDHAGKVRWERSLVAEFGEFKNGHGLAASPCQTADTLFVLIDHQGPSYLLAVEKATGKTKWKTDRGSRSSWASPVLAGPAGKPEVVASSNGSVAGYDPTSGKQLWEKTGVGGNTLPSATPVGDTLLVGAGVGRGGADVKAGKANGLLRLTAGGYEPVWTAAAATAGYASPLAHAGHAYFVNATGVLYCLDLKTGEERYTERLPGPCWASPIAADDRVYFFGKDGRTTVLKAGPEFEVIATNRLWDLAKLPTPPTEKEKGPGGEYMDPIVYGAAAADGGLFVRTGTRLYRIGRP